MSKIETREERVGIVTGYSGQRDVWIISFFEEEGRVEYTSEALEASPLYIDDDLSTVFDERTEMKVCGECGEDAFYNQKTEEFYCPVCKE